MGLQLLVTLLLHQRDTNQLLSRDSLRTLTKMDSLIQSARLLPFMPLLLQLLPMLLPQLLSRLLPQLRLRLLRSRLLLPQLSTMLLPQLLLMPLLLQLLALLLSARPLLPQLLHMLLLSQLFMLLPQPQLFNMLDTKSTPRSIMFPRFPSRGT